MSVGMSDGVFSVTYVHVYKQPCLQSNMNVRRNTAMYSVYIHTYLQHTYLRACVLHVGVHQWYH